MKYQIALLSILIMSLTPVQLTAGPPGVKGGFGEILLDGKKSVKKESHNKKPKQRIPSNKKPDTAKKLKIGYRSIWDPVAY
jgi:hypothetical protein